MVEQILDRDFMLRHLHAFAAYLDREIGRYAAGDPDALRRAGQAKVTGDDLRRARAALSQAQTNPKASAIRKGQEVFLPSDATSSALQASLQRYLLERRPDMIERPAVLEPGSAPITDVSIAGATATETLFEQFGPVDIGWISVGFAALLNEFRGTRPFTPNPAPPHRMSNSVRLILLADWGTGVPRARQVGEAARRSLEDAARTGTEAHVIHLGDVYYSGWAAEYDAHFLPFWPVQPGEEERFGSWSLNGNHDMYSGGHGYFDHLLKDPRFARQAQSSYFSLENDFWQVLALDTAYQEFDLAGNQAEWVAETRSASPSKGGVLLSHHQPFSSYEEAPGRLLERLKPVLDQDRILAWFWGHEHRCTFYKPRNHIRYGRCIGHGGVPVLAPAAPLPAEVMYEFGDWVPGTEPRLARFGFAVVDCVDERMHVEYVMEDGVPHNREDFTRL